MNIGENFKFVGNAERIMLAKGEAFTPCVEAFQTQTDIEVPTFKGERLYATSQGRTFWKVKGLDVPMLIARGLADVGVAGTDACMEYTDQRAVRYVRLGDMMCRFSVLASQPYAEKLEKYLDAGERTSSPLVSVMTSRPRLLAMLASWQGLPLTSIDLPITGSVEAMPSTGAVNAVADLVQSGETARQNDLVEVRRLAYIFPELVLGSGR